MDFLIYILAGAGVGFAVGLTGVGGGSLMTPLLLLFGFPPHIAIGTDLVYAAVTKSGGVVTHRRQGTIRWRIVLLLASASLPFSALTVAALHFWLGDASNYSEALTTCLGFMLITTAFVLIFKKKLQGQPQSEPSGFSAWAKNNATKLTLIMGAALGILVTLSSVGAGAFGTAILLVLYPRLPSIHIVGTDLAHAVPLTLVAGLGHLMLGNVDFILLGSLLIGSLPAIYAGTKLAAHLPDKVLQPVLAFTLLVLGSKYAFF